MESPYRLLAQLSISGVVLLTARANKAESAAQLNVNAIGAEKAVASTENTSHIVAKFCGATSKYTLNIMQLFRKILMQLKMIKEVNKV